MGWNEIFTQLPLCLRLGLNTGRKRPLAGNVTPGSDGRILRAAKWNLRRDPKKQKKLKIQVFQPLPPWNISGFAGFWSFVVFLPRGLINWSPSQFYGDVLVVQPSERESTYRREHAASGDRSCRVKHGLVVSVENVWRWEMLSVFNLIWNTKSFDNVFSIGYHHEIHTCTDSDINTHIHCTLYIYTVYTYDICFFLSGGCWNLWWANSAKARFNHVGLVVWAVQSFIVFPFDWVPVGWEVWSKGCQDCVLWIPGLKNPSRWPRDACRKLRRSVLDHLFRENGAHTILASYGIPTQQPNKKPVDVFKW